jgi:hypothetical protein
MMVIVRCNSVAKLSRRSDPQTHTAVVGPAISVAAVAPTFRRQPEPSPSVRDSAGWPATARASQAPSVADAADDDHSRWDALRRSCT